MKWSFASVGLIVMGLIGVTIIMLFQNITTNNENDYYLLKEVTEASMIDAIDMKYYKETGELKIIKDKFVESFTRRFAESTVFASSDYIINYFDIMEEPPKVTVSINTGIGEYTIYQDTSDYNVYNTLSAILEYSGKNEESANDGYDSNSNSNYNYNYSYVVGTPFVSKTFTKVYYSMPSSNDGNYKVKEPINLPNELEHSNLFDVKISNIVSKGTTMNKGELLFAMLNRDIDWTRTSGDDATDFSADEVMSEQFNNIKSVTVNKSSVRECMTNDECNESKYWVEWSGTGDAGMTVQRFEITWSYSEYEYAE